MSIENKINIICSILGTIISVSAFIYTFKTDKKQKEFEEKDRLKQEQYVKLEHERLALQFIQKYNETNEIQLLPLAIVANNYNDTFPFRRQFYKDWCCLNDLTKEIVLKKCKVELPIKIEENILNVCEKRFKKILNELFEDSYGVIYPDNKIYLEESIIDFKKELAPNNTVFEAKDYAGNFSWAIKYSDVISGIVRKSEVEYILKDEIFKPSNLDILSTMYIKNGTLGDYSMGKNITASYYTCILMKSCALDKYYSLDSAYYFNNSPDNYFIYGENIYMEDEFLDSLYCMYFLKLAKEKSKIDNQEY